MKQVGDKLDEALGLGAQISRRDFLNGTLLSAGAIWSADLSPMALFHQAPETRDGEHWSARLWRAFTRRPKPEPESTGVAIPAMFRLPVMRFVMVHTMIPGLQWR